MLIVFGLSHVVVLTRLPPAAEAPAIEPVAWCVYVILLTEVNDIAQALIGRRLGKHQMAPTFSPGKTWEGLAGGFIVTAGLALLLAPWLTSLTLARPTWLGSCLAVTAGAIISLCGLLGDLNMSGLKRESGVKDSSQLLPGMGGMIDRIDSLTLTAPAFYYFALSLA
jgi:phosphatidate cytidylyltransferase